MKITVNGVTIEHQPEVTYEELCKVTADRESWRRKYELLEQTYTRIAKLVLEDDSVAWLLADVEGAVTGIVNAESSYRESFEKVQMAIFGNTKATSYATTREVQRLIQDQLALKILKRKKKNDAR